MVFVNRDSGSHRQANQTSAVSRHEIDYLGRNFLRRRNEVSLILAVLVIDKDNHPSVAKLFKYFRYFAEFHIPSRKYKPLL
jgi:hypothetical protein